MIEFENIQRNNTDQIFVIRNIINLNADHALMVGVLGDRPLPVLTE